MQIKSCKLTLNFSIYMALNCQEIMSNIQCFEQISTVFFFQLGVTNKDAYH